jgi:MSHA pilin protein MshD
MPRSEPHRQSGFSLLEVIVAIVMLGLIFGGFATVYATVFHEAAEPQLEAQALAVAESYLAEITSRPYRDPNTNGVCAGGEANRPLFDDVCDYNGLALNGCTLTTAACPTLGSCACGRDGAPIDGLKGIVVSASVAPATWSGVNGLQAQVQVTHEGLATNTVTLQSFRTED